MTRRATVILWSALALAVLALGSLVAWMPGRARAYYTDAGKIREESGDAPNRRVLWEPPEGLAPLNTADEEYEARLSADGQTLYFVRGRAGSNAEIYACIRAPDGWSEPRALVPLNTAADELSPEVSADGLTFFFASDRPGGLGGFDLWATRRAEPGSEWTAPANLGPGVNSPFDEYTPAFRPDGALLFASNRPRAGEDPAQVANAWPATIRENGSRHDFDLYIAVKAMGAEGSGTDLFAPAAPVTALNTIANEGTPGFSPVGDFLYFASDRAGGQGGLDLWRSRVVRGEFRPPENLGAAVNSVYQDADPSLSMGGFALHFSSNRPIIQAAAGAQSARPDDYNLYSTTSREVFLERESRPTDWASLWSAIWPPLLWLLLLLLLAWLLYKMRGRLHDRQLSILAKCLIASLFLHLLILFLLSLWGVGSSLGQYFRRPGGGGGRVHLASAGMGDTVAGQVRGSLTDVSVAPTAARPTLSPPELQVQATSPEFARSEAPPLEIRPQPTFNRADPSDAMAAALPPISLTRPEPVALPATAVAVPAEARPAEVGETAVTVAARAAEGSLTRAPSHSPTISSTTVATTAPILEATAPAATGFAPAREAVPTPTPIALSTRPPAELAVSDVPAATIPGQGSPATVAERAIAIESRSAGRTLSPAAPAPALAPAPASTGTVPAIGRLATLPSTGRQGAPAREAAPLPIPIEGGLGSVPETAGVKVALPASPAAGAPASAVEPTVAVSAPAGPSASQSAGSPSFAVSTGVPRYHTSAPAKIRIEGKPGSGASPRSMQEATPGGSMDGSFGLRAPDVPSLPAVASELALPSAGSPTAQRLAEAFAPAIEVSPASRGRGALAPPLMSVVQTPSVSAHSLGLFAGPSGPLNPLPARGAATKDAPSVQPEAGAAIGLSDPDLPPLPTFDLALPTETAPAEDAFAQRAPETRAAIVERLGGSNQTEEAVSKALDWLSRHQTKDGRWSSTRYDDQCGHCSGRPGVDSDKAVTGLAILCFLGADHTHAKDGTYRETVTSALNWLISQQDEGGGLRSGESMYSHGIATIALCEAAAMTRDPALQEPAAKAAAFIVRACDPRSGGWRYEPGQIGDTSVLGWQVMALVSARRAGVEIPEETLRSASRFLDQVSRQKPGIYSYQPDRAPTAPMTAEGLFTRQLLGHKPDEPMMLASVEYISRSPPRWERSANTYYWYYATLALFQHQGDEWTRWNDTLTEVLLERQRDDGPAAGSWDPKDRWSLVGGRVYQTALCTLCLEVYYRYLPMYAQGQQLAPITEDPAAPDKSRPAE